jgi:hypothetical protein
MNRYARTIPPKPWHGEKAIQARVIHITRDGDVDDDKLGTLEGVNEALQVYQYSVPTTRERLAVIIDKANCEAVVSTRELERIAIAVGAEMAGSNDPFVKIAGSRVLSEVHGWREKRVLSHERYKAMVARSRLDRGYVDHKTNAALERKRLDAERRQKERRVIDRETMTP